MTRAVLAAVLYILVFGVVAAASKKSLPVPTPTARSQSKPAKVRPRPAKAGRPAALPDMANFGLHDLLVCDGEHGLSRYDWRTKKSDPILKGVDVHDVEPQSDGSYLIAGPAFVGLFRKEEGGDYRLAWEWGRLNLPCVVNAVAADREWGGEPSLVLASDCTLNRLVLAEAKTDDPKIRWEFKLPGPPQRVSLCRDSGNFLVTMKIHSLGFGEAPQVAEVFFREDRIGWSLNSKDGILNTQDAVRDSKSHTMVVTGGKKPEVSCYDMEKKQLWRRGLPATADASYTLSICSLTGRERLLVCVRPKGTAHPAGKKCSRPKNPTGLYLLDPDDGKLLAFTKEPALKGPAPLHLVVDGAEAGKSKR